MLVSTQSSQLTKNLFMQYRPFLKYLSQISTQQSTRKVELYNTKITCFLVQIATQRKVKILRNKEKVRWVLLPTAPPCLCSQTGVGEGSPAAGSASVPGHSQTSEVGFGSCTYFKRKTKVVSPRAFPSFHFGVL